MKTTQLELIDTHAHLYLDDFSADRPSIIERAKAEGVSRVYLPALDRAHFQAVADLEASYPGFCFSMIGIHPVYVRDNYREELAFIEAAMATRSYAAVGEIGLDYYWERKFDEYQMIAFEEQLKLADKYSRPVVIHSRSSMNETIQVLRRHRGVNGIFHCFSGTLENAQDIIDCGFLLGIGGVVTYKNAGLDKVVAELPLESLVLETDAPYLTPVPFRGKRNESSYLRYVVEKIAAIKNTSVEDVASITTANAKRIFS